MTHYRFTWLLAAVLLVGVVACTDTGELEERVAALEAEKQILGGAEIEALFREWLCPANPEFISTLWLVDAQRVELAEDFEPWWVILMEQPEDNPGLDKGPVSYDGRSERLRRMTVPDWDEDWLVFSTMADRRIFFANTTRASTVAVNLRKSDRCS